MALNLLNHNELTWRTYSDLTDKTHPISYADAVLSVSDDGRLQIVVKWEPNCFCHFHRHTAETSSVVLAGELTVIDIDPSTGEEIQRNVRATGDFSHKPAGDVHREQAGPDGALVLFTIYAPNDDVAQALDENFGVFKTTTISQIMAKRAPENH